jgi:hypothetical protein
MKVNKPFQALIASLNLQGKGEIIEVPDRGVVGEIKQRLGRRIWT